MMNSTMQTIGDWMGMWRLELLLGINLLLLMVTAVLVVVIFRRLSTWLHEDLPGRVAVETARNESFQQSLHHDLARSRREAAESARQAREELSGALHRASDAMLKRMTEIAGMQKDQLDSFSKQLEAMTRLNESRFEALRQAVAQQLRHLQEDNNKHLTQMRVTVDEKLQDTLEKRLGASFRQVSERLEQVYRGLGEMRTLASGVGDLKKVLANVKTRGTWGEIRLNSILEQILTPEQYALNVATRQNSPERVEFAIKLPGPHNGSRGEPVWLPIDSKFPQEDYQRLLDAQENADRDAAEKSIKALETRVKAEAKSIRDKYIEPPHTTDFGIMFLPVEGLYAEVLRRPGLCDFLQREYRIVVTGPTTLAALLNSLQMGFRTLAIEKRSGEVWELLGAVKGEFGKFGDLLARTKKKLQEASNSIDHAEVRSRAIERKLRDVAESPFDATPGVLEAAEKTH